MLVAAQPRVRPQARAEAYEEPAETGSAKPVEAKPAEAKPVETKEPAKTEGASEPLELRSTTR